MAITLENTSTPIDIDAGSGNPVTLTGANTIAITVANMLIVQVMLRDATTVTGISHNGKTFTLARGDGSGPRTEIWYLNNPDVGTYDIIITFSAAGESIACAFGLIGTGCSIGDVNGGTGTGTLASAIITTIQDDSWILAFSGNSTLSEVTAYGGGQTEIWMLDVGGGPSGRKNAASSREEKTPFGEDTQEITWIASVDWAISCVEIRPTQSRFLVLCGDTNWLFVAGGGAYENVIKKVDGSGDMAVNDTHTLTNGRKIRGIDQDTNYLYVTCEEDGAGDPGFRVIKVAKSDWTETALALDAIGGHAADAVGACLVDGTTLIIAGGTATNNAAMWKITDLGNFDTFASAVEYTTFQSNRVYEDFQGFAIVDPDTRFTLWHHNCVEFQAERDETSYMTYDYTAAHFDDFTHKFKVIVEATPDDGAKGYIWMIATALGNAKALDDASEDYLGVYFERSGSNYIFGLEECNGGAVQSDTYIGLSAGEDYYFAVTKAVTALTCQIYSTQALLDTGGAGDVDTLTLTITDNTFQYLYAGNTYNDTTDVAVTMDIENFVIGETTIPGGIIAFYPDTTYIWAATENGMFYKITKADLSFSDSAYIIPLGCHIPGHAVHFESGYGKDGENFFVTTCTLKHLLGNLAENLGWQSILADPDGDWTSFSCAYGASGYLYLGAGNINEVKKVDLSDMSVPTTLTLSTGTNGINGVWISPS